MLHGRYRLSMRETVGAFADLLGENFTGVVTSDRYRAYLTLPVERRRICWAHPKRNLVALAERGGSIGDWGKEEVALVTNMFGA